jgi:hypothetical protein
VLVTSLRYLARLAGPSGFRRGPPAVIPWSSRSCGYRSIINATYTTSPSSTDLIPTTKS